MPAGFDMYGRIVRKDSVLARIKKDAPTRWLTADEMASKMQISRQASVKHLKRLFDEGELERRPGPRRTWCYRLKRNG